MTVNLQERRRAILSSLWIVFFLNMLFRDIHEIAKPSFIAEMESMGDPPEVLMLVAGVVLSLAIAMVFLVRVLPPVWNRWMNVGVGVLMLAGMASNRPGDMDDWWFAAVELVVLALIVKLAWPLSDGQTTPE